MTLVAFTEKIAPNFEFVFKGKITCTKLNPPPNVTVQWALKGSYRFQQIQVFVNKAVPDVLYKLFSQLKKIYSLDDYSVFLDLSISDAKKNAFCSMGGGITGDIQVNGTDLYHPPKTFRRDEKSKVMLDKLTADSTKISATTRENVMRMLCSAWDKTTSDFDMELAFTQNTIIINLDGSEDRLVKTCLSILVMEEMKKFRARSLQSSAPRTMKQLKQLISSEGLKRNNPPLRESLDEGYELLNGEYLSKSDEEDEELENSVAEEDENHLDVTKNNKEHPVNVNANNDIEKDLAASNRLSHLEVVKQSLCLEERREFLKSEQALTSIDLKTLASIGLYPFFLKTKNLLANERYLRTWAKSMKMVEVN